jgi:hypothetical protein
MLGDYPARYNKAWILCSLDSVFLTSIHFSSAPPNLPYEKYSFFLDTFVFYPIL